MSHIPEQDHHSSVPSSTEITHGPSSQTFADFDSQVGSSHAPSRSFPHPGRVEGGISKIPVQDDGVHAPQDRGSSKIPSLTDRPPSHGPTGK